jgi:hypothetical protein
LKKENNISDPQRAVSQENAVGKSSARLHPAGPPAGIKFCLAGKITA